MCTKHLPQSKRLQGNVLHGSTGKSEIGRTMLRIRQDKHCLYALFQAFSTLRV